MKLQNSKQEPQDSVPMINDRRSVAGGERSATCEGRPGSSAGVNGREADERAGYEPVDGKLLLDELEGILKRYVILPAWAAETLALWALHTYAFEFRDVTTYIGVESPEKRCGKTTLLGVLSELVNRPVVAANISSPAFFRVIEETRPTLLIDEADTFLQGSDELRGILNAGYSKKTAFVWRVTNDARRNFKLQTTSLREAASLHGQKAVDEETEERESRVAKFSCWCPKMICAIGRLPDTLADRCVVIGMERKRADETCERLRDLDGRGPRERCERFVKEHQSAIAGARPRGATDLNDRAADIWEPLLALADLAGGPWPEKARQAASHLTIRGQEGNPIGSLLMDIFIAFVQNEARKVKEAGGEGGAVEKGNRAPEADGNRLFSKVLVEALNRSGVRPWRELVRGKEVTELWLAQRLRAYGIRPRMMRIGGQQSRGYVESDFMETFRRYVPRSEVEELRERLEKRSAGDGDSAE
jgi:hypothetical protein